MRDRKEQQTRFLEAFDDHSDELFRFCIAKTRNRDIALDVVQETFAKAWEYAAKGNEIKDIRPFLYRIARNLIIDLSRKHTTHSLDYLVEEGIEFSLEDQAEKTMYRIDAELSLQILEELDEAYQDILRMRYIHNLDIKEIAKTIGVTENVVSVRIHRGLKKLKEILHKKSGI